MSEKVTVLMPVYNREKFVSGAIQSILEQTYKNFDFVIYDDGSSDKTIKEVQKFNDKRIRLILGGKNKGVSFARNTLLNLCETKYALWQDSDDFSNIHRIEKQIKMAQENKMVFTNFGILKTDTNWREEPKDRIYTFASASCLFPINKQIKFNEELNIGEDKDWRDRMIKEGNIKFIETITKILYYIRFHHDRNSVIFRKSGNNRNC